MPESDYDAIKRIIDDIVGNTNQGIVLLNAIKSYFDEKESIQIVKKEIVIKNHKGFRGYKYSIEKGLPKDAKEAMKRYTSRLNRENAKFRKKNKKSNCSTNS